MSYNGLKQGKAKVAKLKLYIILPVTESVIDLTEGGVATKIWNKLYKCNKYSAFIEPCLKTIIVLALIEDLIKWTSPSIFPTNTSFNKSSNVNLDRSKLVNLFCCKL